MLQRRNVIHWYINKRKLCLQCRYRHRNLSVIVPVSPYKILYSYVALVPAPSCIWQYKFVHKFAGTLDTVINKINYFFIYEGSPAVIGGRGGRDEDEQLALLDVTPIADALRKQPRVNMC